MRYVEYRITEYGHCENAEVTSVSFPSDETYISVHGKGNAM